ncbi:MAG: hypothetical protein A3J38_05020 [Gammaproteobacteria bacterium RIFCSPHIGHO2_12_FULL_45_9]|nr:MAG: hypothetical protein A3J38_05020 [Gammaproteobacteria bacterium RIFCSPHIGHO2_12_FULL_45_9]
MTNPREFMQIWRLSKQEALIYFITFLAMIGVDLLAGIQAGVIAALIIAALRLGQTRTRIRLQQYGPVEIALDGAITFLSAAKLTEMATTLQTLPENRHIIIDCADVHTIDAAGAEQLVKWILQIRTAKRRVAIQGLSPECRAALLRIEDGEKIGAFLASDATELFSILHDKPKELVLDRLVYGIEIFKRRHKKSYQRLFQKLEFDQAPHTLFITCCDSRINPNLITSTEPGELFVLRNVGNVIPVYNHTCCHSEGAALAFAINMLKVKEVVICAHSECGAMKELLKTTHAPTEEADAPRELHTWLRHMDYLKQQFTHKTTPEQAAKLNAIQQIEHLKSYPFVQERLAAKHVRIHAWYYDIGQSELEQWSPKDKMYIPISHDGMLESEKRARISAIHFTE